MSLESNPNEALIKKICLNLLDAGKTEVYDNDILLEIVREKRCNPATAEIILSDMLQSGLIACGRKYDILEFVLLKDKFSKDELQTLLETAKIPVKAEIGGR
ncbi:MAG: hypothetical protein WAO91_00420 [Candidatus Nitrosotenuis sp.]